MFCDELQLELTAGKGGNGCASFRREKFVPRGGPDGGDGGRGGNIVFVANRNINTLGHLASKRKYTAKNGGNGMGQKMHGRKAEDLVIEVPVGTMIFISETNELIKDLKSHEEKVVVCKGGRGGLGNVHFMSSTHQAPHIAEFGEPGEKKNVKLELKLIADIGIIGFPSAGKSTLISVISDAKPKIADYDFTTLEPNLGVIFPKKFNLNISEKYVIADIPGLIEGASEGKGLGHQFLKHITRTGILIHLLDGAKEELGERYKTIRNELKKFSKNLYQKDEIVVINKCDAVNDEEMKIKAKELKKRSKKTPLIISAATNQGIKELLIELIKRVNENRNKIKEQELSEMAQIKVYQPHLEEKNYRIDKVINKKTHKVFRVTGEKVEKLIVMTDISHFEGKERIYRLFEQNGLKKALERKGAKIGDIIKINGVEIPYRK